MALVGYWKFDNDVLDSSGQGNHGTIYGDPQFVDGVHRQGLSFDTTPTDRDYVNIPVISLSHGSWSVCFWARPASNGVIIPLGRSTNNGTIYFNQLDIADQARIRIILTDWTQKVFYFGRALINELHHFAMVSESDGTIRMYLDGGEVDTESHTNTAISFSRIGDGWSVPTYGYSGMLDEVRIYTNALSAAEVFDVYEGVGLYGRGATVPFGMELRKTQNRPFHLVQVHFSDGVFYMTDAGRAVEWDGNIYLAYGHTLNFSNIKETAQLLVNTVTAEISAVDQQFVSAYLSKNYLDRTVKIYRAFFDGDNKLVAQPLSIFTGRMDAPVLEEDPDTGKSVIQVTAANHFVDFERTAGRRTNTTSQQLFYPGDKGFKFASEVVRDLKWGAA